LIALAASADPKSFPIMVIRRLGTEESDRFDLLQELLKRFEDVHFE
jgi:hypothetical protein